MQTPRFPERETPDIHKAPSLHRFPFLHSCVNFPTDSYKSSVPVLKISHLCNFIVWQLFTKIHLYITIIQHKKDGLICSDRLYADISSTTKLYFCISTNQIYKAINADRDILSLSSTKLSPPKDRIKSPIIIVWNCSMTSQKYRVVCLSDIILRKQMYKIWLSGIRM